jgi:hypothetical protein
MNEKDFRRMLKAVRQSDSIDNKLMDVFKNKIDSGVLVAIDVYELIYCSQWAKKQPDFIKMCFDYLDQTPGNYINFMAYLQRDGLIKEAYSETEAYRGSFFARYVFVSEDDTKLIVGKSTQNINKKKAIQEAARDINIGLYEDTLVELEEDSPIIPEDFKFQGVNMSKSASPNQISPTSDDTINYIGAINEVAQKHSQFSILSCDFKDMGGDGPNRFICTFTVSIIDEVKKIQAAGKNKKMAKSNAASEVFAVIRDGGLKKSGDVFAGH